MLKVYTTNDIFSFEGEEAKRVYKAIDEAGARCGGWTVPIPLSHNRNITFVLSNIIALELNL